MGKPRIMFRICFGARFGALRAFPAPTTWTDAGLPSLRGAVEQSETEGGHLVANCLPSNWTLHIVGDGPERQTIEMLIKSAGSEAENRIKLLGYKTGENLQREVGNARFSVLCSEWRENMPYSGLESLAAQTPVIGANIGGIPELVVEGETGFKFESGNQDDLAQGGTGGRRTLRLHAGVLRPLCRGTVPTGYVCAAAGGCLPRHSQCRRHVRGFRRCRE